MLDCRPAASAMHITILPPFNRWQSTFRRPGMDKQRMPHGTAPEGVDGCQGVCDEGVVQNVPWQLAQLLRQQAPAQRCSMQQAVCMELCPVAANLHAGGYKRTGSHVSTCSITSHQLTSAVVHLVVGNVRLSNDWPLPVQRSALNGIGPQRTGRLSAPQLQASHAASGAAADPVKGAGAERRGPLLLAAMGSAGGKRSPRPGCPAAQTTRHVLCLQRMCYLPLHGTTA